MRSLRMNVSIADEISRTLDLAVPYLDATNYDN